MSDTIGSTRSHGRVPYTATWTYLQRLFFAKRYFGLFLQSLEYTHDIQSFGVFFSTNLEHKEGKVASLLYVPQIL